MAIKDDEIPLRVTLVGPPVDVTFALQRGRAELVQTVRSTGKPVSFDFTVRVRTTGNTLRILGPFCQGTPTSRFVYVNSGTFAGDSTSCWSRRAKICLSSVTRQLIKPLQQTPGSVLEARIAGTGRDGGPACASVPLLEPGWTLRDDRAS